MEFERRSLPERISGLWQLAFNLRWTWHQEAREVFRQMCFERRDFRIEPGIPFTDTCNIAVPATAMHSFQAPHNLVRWKLVVRGEAETWPLYERGFPIVVYPGEATMQVEVGSHVSRNALKAPALAAAAGVRA